MRIELAIGWRYNFTGNTEQGAEGVERIKAAVEAERELVEVCLQVLRADAVIRW